MTVNGNAIVRGLFLSFPALRSCADRLKTLGIRFADMSVLLADGSIVSATAVEFLQMHNAKSAAPSDDPARHHVCASTLTRALLSLGIPAYISEGLECRIRNGGILVSVRCDGSVAASVEGVFIQSGGEDVSCAPEKRIEVLHREGSRKQTYRPQPAEFWQQRNASA